MGRGAGGELLTLPGTRERPSGLPLPETYRKPVSRVGPAGVIKTRH